MGSLWKRRAIHYPIICNGIKDHSSRALTDLAYLNLHSLHIYCAELDNLEIKMLKHLTELLLLRRHYNDLSAL